jgi:uncharacterized RDD family membrane protein YckC
MKCPKCDYLGFETGDRCKNCGYDFSLTTDSTPADRDLPLRESESLHRDPDRWLNQLEARLDTVRPVAASSAASDPLGSMSLNASAATPAAAPRPVSAPARVPAAEPASAPAVQPPAERLVSRSTPALPLFHPGGADWDEPLIKVPAAPRAPLAVRRTPDKPKLRTVPKPVRRVLSGSDPVLGFGDDSAGVQTQAATSVSAPSRQMASPGPVGVSGPARRLIAAGLDHLILLSIDAIVIYFTFQIAGLPFSSWQEIPILPLALFLLLVKGSYFCVFTTLGGQTVGKMATGIRVVTDNDRDVEPTRALQRTLATLASFVTVGIGFAPVLFAGDRRALHDRLAGTRVVGPVHE